ncbi:P-loop containing nucleoside triphosphate hydrolase protein [Rhizoclosmatium globosum]|uniref:p-loop containing nucleoside triphosphate hydrolase protein n=1 Tax=Rhizoclosmatium globosum TaxID=329046 RepID=A0A1Y2CRH8_9FUNG|nr:P-loop containing nucleoside triphosphate hydrolase protein [Rhizoclosmatium globosum]|eukprot:ORY49444.1 P-loop containing nucleoside triphosphate hydrolase protein [Rhizoclosmatium globosum]
MDPLFRYGYRNTLGLSDLFPLAQRYHAAELADSFEEQWKVRLERYQQETKEYASNTDPKKKPPKEPSTVSILVDMFGKGFFPIGLLKFTADLINSTAPLLMQVILAYIKSSSGIDPPPLHLGLIYAFSLFLLNMTASTCIQFFFSRASAYGMSMRATLTAAIYRKSLRLSGAARQRFNPGHITNIISTDLTRMELFIVFFHLQWTFPTQIIIVVTLLIHVIGTPALAGLALLVCMVPFQIWVIKVLVNLRKSNAKTTDERIRLTSETLSSIRVIKFFAWEDSFLERIFAIRAEELKAVISGNMIRSIVTASAFVIPVLASVATMIVYSATSDVFDPTVIFTVLALFNQLRNPLMWVPQMLSSWADASVAISRIQALLLSEENSFEPILDKNCPSAVKVENGDFRWELADTPETASTQSLESKPSSPETSEAVLLKDLTTTTTTTESPQDRLHLNNINLSIPPGSLVAIIGEVGSGKSTLLSAICGQLKPAHSSAKVTFNGSIGYVPQQAWIMNATLRDNILFGLPFDQARYDHAIEVCALRRDLEVLSGGDLAEIGERGINLSGGQKQRVSLARLVYFDSEIVLLDDVLSAVDAHVGQYIFTECIRGALGGKTRLLVTHQLHFVPQCDFVVTMKNGSIAEFGTYAELMESGGEFSKLMYSYGGVTENAEPEEEVAEKVVKKEASAIAPTTNTSVGKELVAAEDRETGAVKTSVVVSFAVAMGGWPVVILLIFLLVLAQACRIATDLWLVYWSQYSIANLTALQYRWIYFGLGITQGALVILFSVLVAIGGTVAAKTLHQDALRRIIHTPSSFFDTNPLGRVLNRFSRDQDIIDNTLPDAVRMFFISFGMAISTFCLVSYSTSGWFLIALVPLMAAYYFIQGMYRATARELKRLDATTRSPLYSHINESMTGVNTIRAYREQTRFISKTDFLIDQTNAPYYLQQLGARWLGMRLEYIGNALVLATSIFGVSSRSSISPALMGLALSYVLQTTQLLQLCIRQYTEAEVQLVSIERMHHYATKVETEAAGVIEDHRPPAHWPSEGIVEFKNVSMRYQPGLPLVLKDVALVTKKHEKIGVVGRTGSGKSSLMLSLFRIVEPSGEIEIDGITTSAIGLKDLRSRLSIIPQDPLLFSGTVRLNLDPFHEHDDQAIWSALDASGLKEAVAAMDGGLDAAVNAGGDNMSVGQRQLMCLARAILRKSALVVLDECTANVDLATDHQIQQTLRTTMKEATIFTIAHRLNTVIDSDRILVLDNGNVVEFDTPKALLNREGSIFAAMVNETGAQNAAALKALANA